MPSLSSNVGATLAQLVTDVGSAWTDVTTVFIGSPRVVPTAPWAVVSIDTASMQWATTNSVDIDCPFEIVGVFPNGTTTTALDDKIGRVDDLVAVLEASTEYVSIGMLPLVTEVGFADSETYEDCYEVRLTFIVRFEKTYGT